MKILDAWPTKPAKQTQVERAQPYLDGQIYQFDVEDCHVLFGMPIEAVRYSHETTDEDLAKHTKYLRGRAIQDLDTMLRNGARRTHGPYQSRSRIVGSTVTFQWTGLQQCRLKVCEEQALEDCKGYCGIHYAKKKGEGKVT
ncbi:MAG: hypothetical protein DRQ39_04395 [Gammaproteobacteria bacterium]|nr:MAG: hypothetical protein DRQ39_04395 [Gammaproteobacteria bacterium]